MPSTTFNWKDESGAFMSNSEINISSKANKDTIPYLKTRISNLNIRLSKSADPIERADIADEISKCQKRITELEAGAGKMKAKPVTGAPSMADKEHRENMTTGREIMRGQIVATGSSFVSLI